MANILEDMFGGGDIPHPGLVNLDPGTVDLMNQSVERSKQSSGDIAKESLDPAVAAARQTYGSDSGVASEEQRRGGLMDPNMISAIRSKQGQMLGQHLTNLKQNTAMDAFNQRRERLNFAQNAMIAKQKIENANYQRLIAATNNENEIRAGVLKNWMSLAGSVVGGIYGGPAGAAAGGAAGGGLGSAMTGRSGQVNQIDFGQDVTMPTGGRSYSGGVTQNDYLGSGPSYNFGDR